VEGGQAGYAGPSLHRLGYKEMAECGSTVAGMTPAAQDPSFNKTIVMN